MNIPPSIKSLKYNYLYLYLFGVCYSGNLIIYLSQKAKRSYQKDLASFQEARESNAQDLETADGSSMPGGNKNWFCNFFIYLGLWFEFEL